MGYLAAAKLYNVLVLHCANTFAQIGTLFKLPSQTWSVSSWREACWMFLINWVEIFRMQSRRC